MTTVKVQFKDGEREVPAHQEPQSTILPDVMSWRLVPDDMPGYEFLELITGRWVAVESVRD